MTDTVREWIAKAEGDFGTAGRELAAPEPRNLDAVCRPGRLCGIMARVPRGIRRALQRAGRSPGVISEGVIEDAVRLLRETADPVRIVLFGEQARGEARDDSDLDLLVVERDVPRRRAETNRLLDALRPLRMPVDVLVASEQQVRDWGDVPGTVLHDALREGRVLYDAA